MNDATPEPTLCKWCKSCGLPADWHRPGEYVIGSDGKPCTKFIQHPMKPPPPPTADEIIKTLESTIATQQAEVERVRGESNELRNELACTVDSLRAASQGWAELIKMVEDFRTAMNEEIVQQEKQIEEEPSPTYRMLFAGRLAGARFALQRFQTLTPSPKDGEAGEQAGTEREGV